MQYLISFFEGIITFISPCLLPMLPVYVSYFAGSNEKDTKATVKNALGFVLGFSITFMLLGVFAGALGSLLIKYRTAVNVVSGLVVIFFGLAFMGIFKLKFFTAAGSGFKLENGSGFWRSVLFGMVFSISWTPCVGAFLGSALMLASQQGSVFKGVLLLLVYSLGLGIPFVLSAILIDRLKSAFAVIKRHYKIITTVSGLLLIIIGILMMTGQLNALLIAASN